MIYPSAEVSERTLLEAHPHSMIGSFVLISVPRLILGEGSQINAGSKITGKAEVIVGKHVVIAYNVVILSSSDRMGPYMDDASPPEARRVLTEPVRIGDYAYVGSLSCLMPGVVLEEGAVVGSNMYVPPRTRLTAWTTYIAKPFIERGRRPSSWSESSGSGGTSGTPATCSPTRRSGSGI